MRLKLFAAITSMVAWTSVMPEKARAVQLVDNAEWQ